MSMTVNFRGGESTGSVSDRTIETAKQETTGGVGVRARQDSIFLTEEPKSDTVCFRGQEYSDANKKSNKGLFFATLVADAAILVGLLGLTHKYDVINKYVKDGKFKDILKCTDKVTEPCHQACKWVKNNSYDKIVEFVKSKK